MTFGDNLSSILPTSHKLKPNINSCINLNLFQVYGTNHLVFSPGSSAVEKFEKNWKLILFMEWYLQIKLGVLAWGILEVVDDNFFGEKNHTRHFNKM